jgi:hypothetical protein
MERIRGAVVESPDFWRQLSVCDPEDLPPVIVIGAGGIGSFTIMALAKMGVRHLAIYDPDSVEAHNIPNQIFGPEAVGKSKVMAASDLCAQLAGISPSIHEERLSRRHRLNGVVVSGVDSMKSRKEVWRKVKKNPDVPLYVEARMGAEVSRIHSVNPSDPKAIKWYESTLYEDSAALDLPCTARAIIYNGFSIGALIANQVKKWAGKEDLFQEIIFDLKTLTLMTQ